MNVNGCRLPLTICGGNTQLHVGRLAVRAQINWEGCLELGICWNHTSLPISFLQLSIQFSLLQNTYPSVPEFQDFHSSNLENVCIKFFFSCRRLHYSNSQTLHVAMNSSWIRHGAVDTFATICSSALLSMEPSSLPKPLFKKAHNIYSILSTILYNSMLLLLVVIYCSYISLLLSSGYFSKFFISAPSPSGHKCNSYTLAVLLFTWSSQTIPSDPQVGSCIENYNLQS